MKIDLYGDAKHIDSQAILYSKGNNDECMTPRCGVMPVLKYLSKDKIVWCPFDKEDSEFVKVLTEQDYKVVYSHIDNGQDFYTYEPEEWDVIVSNPPSQTRERFLKEP